MTQKKTAKRGRPPIKHTPKSIDDKLLELIIEIQQTYRSDDYINDLGLRRFEKQMNHIHRKFEMKYAIDRSK